MKIPTIRQVVGDAGQSFARFPFVLINAMIGTVVTIILIEHEGPMRASVLFNLLYAALLGIPLLLAISLSVEKMQLSLRSSVAAHAAGIAALIAYGLSTPSYLDDMPLFQLYRFLLFFAAAHCLVTALPFLSANGQRGFWRFAMALLFRFVVSAFFSIVLMMGVSVGLAALDQLFGIDVPGKRYAELNIFIIGIFNTWFFLAGIPRDYQELELSDEYPKVLKIFSQYILAPLVLIYLIILYAYIFKIAFLWTWPEGWVSRLIVGFSGTGMLALLLLFPLRDREEFRWVRAFWQWYFVVLIPLIALLPLAVFQRISAYGMTEGRYVGLAIAAWLCLMVVYFLFSRTKKIQIIPASLTAALVLAGVGPWSAFSISENDQIRRLTDVLIRNEMLADDTLCKSKHPVSIEDARQISAIITYLHSDHGYGKIQPWFRESLQSGTGSGIPRLKSPEAMTRLLGVEYVASRATGSELSLFLSADEKKPVDIRGYDRLLGPFFVGRMGGDREFAGEGITLKPLTEHHQLEFSVESISGMKEAARIDVGALAAGVVNTHGNTGVRNLPGDTLSASVQAAGRTIKVFFRTIQLERREGKLVPVSCSMVVALTKQ